MDMEKLLTGLFDFQRFEKDQALQGVIDEVEGRYFVEELSDDELELYSAAGDPYLQLLDPKERDVPH